MTVRDVIEFFESVLQTVFTWISDFTTEFIDVLFWRVSFMDSSVFTVICVLVAYCLFVFWLLERPFIRRLFNKAFREEERQRLDTKRRRQEKLGRRLARKAAERRADESEKRERNTELWDSSGQPGGKHHG